MILHIVKNSPFALTDAGRKWIDRLSETDGLLLIEDAVYGMLDPEFVKSLPSQRSYCLKSDLLIRGIPVQSDKVEIVDDADWVELCLTYQKTLSW